MFKNLKLISLSTTFSLTVPFLVACGYQDNLQKENQIEIDLDNLKKEIDKKDQTIKEKDQEINDLNQKLKDFQQEKQYGGHELRIFSKTLNGTKEIDEIYISSKEHKNVVDLMLDVNKINQRKKQDPVFNFSKHKDYGYMLLGINGVDAIYDEGSWWKIVSPTLEGNVEYSRDHSFKDLERCQLNKWMTNVGVSSMILDQSIILGFIETKSNDFGC